MLLFKFLTKNVRISYTMMCFFLFFQTVITGKRFSRIFGVKGIFLVANLMLLVFSGSGGHFRIFLLFIIIGINRQKMLKCTENQFLFLLITQKEKILETVT